MFPYIINWQVIIAPCSNHSFASSIFNVHIVVMATHLTPLIRWSAAGIRELAMDMHTYALDAHRSVRPSGAAMMVTLRRTPSIFHGGR